MDAMDMVRPFGSTVVVDVMLTVLPDWLPGAGYCEGVGPWSGLDPGALLLGMTLPLGVWWASRSYEG